jgi:hypothetical protein
MAIHLDDNERAMLRAYVEEDPDGESWIAPWVDGINILKHGGDAVAASFDGRVAVARRLTTRKLLEGQPGVRGNMRGYAITDKGKSAVAEPA